MKRLQGDGEKVRKTVVREIARSIRKEVETKLAKSDDVIW
jgi:hypothetical protein